jgi:hypothetical protein
MCCQETWNIYNEHLILELGQFPMAPDALLVFKGHQHNEG